MKFHSHIRPETLMCIVIITANLFYLFLFTNGNIRAICNPYLNEYREMAQIDAAYNIFKGLSPYPSDPNQSNIYLYGPIYPFICSMFYNEKWPVSDMFVLCRGISFICSLITAAIGCVIICKSFHDTNNYTVLLKGAIGITAFNWLIKSNWLFVYGVANPAATGTLLMIISLLFAEKKKPLFSSLFVILAFFTKAYFLAVAVPIGIFYFLTEKRIFVAYCIYVVSGIIISLTLICHIYPYFFYYVFLHHQAAYAPSINHLLKQMVVAAGLMLPLEILGAIGVFYMKKKIFVNIYFISFLSLFVIWLRLGMHQGAYMSYIFQLWFVPYTIFAFQSMVVIRQRYIMPFCIIILLWNIAPPFSKSYSYSKILPTSNNEYVSQIHQLRQLNSDSVLCISPWASRMALETGIKNIDNGQNQYINSLSHTYRGSALVLYLPEKERMQNIAVNYDSSILRIVQSKKYKVIISDDDAIIKPKKLLECGYQPYDSLKATSNVSSKITCWNRKE